MLRYHRDMALQAGVSRVIRVCDSTVGSRSLRLALLDEIRRFIGFDAFAWLLTDPETEVGADPVADVPSLSELPRLIRLKYLTTVNRWTKLSGPLGLLRSATGDRRELSLVWREMLSSYDVGDVASLVFRDHFGCWGFLDLWRFGGEAAFTAQEAHNLTGIAGPVTEALRMAQARTFDLLGGDLTRNGPVVLALSPELGVRTQTPETDGYLRQLVPTGTGQPPIPAGAYNVAAQLLAAESGVDDHPPAARVHLAEGKWLTLRAARMGGSEVPGEQDIAVTIEPTSPAERAALYIRAWALSTREAELVGHLAAGGDTREVADRMYISTNTVQDHLKSIFAKTGAPNRRTLLARASGR